ncbi:hypothetical protein P3S67_007993 [Capsicum chacoense]
MGRLFFFYSLVSFIFLSQSFSSSYVHHLCSSTRWRIYIQFKLEQSFQISDSHICWDDEYRSIDFPKTSSWNESDGVTCNMLMGHVIGLDLSCSQLQGTIHPNSSLFQLHHLQRLNLAHNNFYPSIPNGIGRLRNLRHLNLSDSFFEGKIPKKSHTFLIWFHLIFLVTTVTSNLIRKHLKYCFRT